MKHIYSRSFNYALSVDFMIFDFGRPLKVKSS